MKAVLMSIQSKWCELIASGKKTIEVRKSKPKLDTPFKVYFYCTKAKNNIYTHIKYEENEIGECINGKVIGEFVCDDIYNFIYNLGGFLVKSDLATTYDTLAKSCLSHKEFRDYAKDKTVYGWHISNLVIYDKPKELSEFYNIGVTPPSSINEMADSLCDYCHGTKYSENKYICISNKPIMCEGRFCEDAYAKYLEDFNFEHGLKRPPRSWCYPNKRVLHLAKKHKSKRVRKKNMRRIKRWLEKRN